MSMGDGLLRTRFVAAATTTVLVWALFAGLTVNVSADTGGDDVYGYSWTDSNAPTPSVLFSWVDITGTGTNSLVTGDDVSSSAVPIGFAFPFYGSDYTNVYFSSNGLITLTGGSSDWGNDPIPSANAPDLIIAPFWDDLMVDVFPYNTGVIYYQTIGVAPDRQFIIEWWQVSHYYSYDLLTFEAILSETGEILFQYLTLSGDNGYSATVGIEDEDGMIGCEYSYNSPVLSDSLAVSFTPPPTGVDPVSQSGRAQPGDSLYYGLTIMNYKSVTDSYDITGESAAGWTMAFLDSMHNPLTDTNSNGIPDTGDVTSGGTVEIIVRVYVPTEPLVQDDVGTVNVSSYVEPADWTLVEVRTTVFGAQFAPPYSEEAVDTDDDGLYNRLEVDVPLDVAFDGHYMVEGRMYDVMASHVDTETFEGDLESGEAHVTLAYDGWKMNLYGHDGPYDIQLRLYEYDGVWWDLASDLHTTGTYTADEFDDPPASLEPPYSDHGEDYNSNGYYDALVIVVPVNVTEEGDFYLHMGLWDEWFSYIDDAEVEVHLEAGIREVAVAFDGRDLWDYGHEGPYYTEFTLETGEGDYLDDDSYDTDEYRYREFEPPGAALSLTHSEYGLDTNGNGYYDYLVVEASVHVFMAGTYRLEGQLLDSWMWLVDSDTNTTYLEAGIHIVQLMFSGKNLYLYGYDGRYFVDLILMEADWDEIDWAQHETEVYGFAEFEPPGARLEAPHSDYATDTNDNGYYDYLIINVSVNVSTAGYYNVYIWLYDSLLWYIGQSSNNSYLESGVQEVQVLFLGLMLNTGAYDGPYTADVLLEDDEWFFLDSDLYTTGAYTWDEFEPPGAELSPPHEDSGTDTDDDGLFDVLTLNVTVDVLLAGDYALEASLWPVFATAYSETYLESGVQTVQLTFDGQLIRAGEYNGTMTVDIWLIDSNGYFIDWDVHTTSAYTWDQFEPPPIRLSPPHADYGLDSSGGSDYEALIVEVSVEVEAAGLYHLDASIWGGPVARAEEYLEQGNQTVLLDFPAWPLYSLEHTGVHFVEIYVYDADDTEWDYGTHETASYAYDDFNGSIPLLSSGWTEVAPAIDGVVDPAEWAGAGTVDVLEEDDSNDVAMTIKVMNNATHLFFLYDIVGITEESDNDLSGCYFDTGNDGVHTVDEEDHFQMFAYPNETYHYVSTGAGFVQHCYPFNPVLPEHAGLAGAYGFGPSELGEEDHRIFEYSIPLSLMEAEPGDVLGYCAVVMSSSTWEYSWWPNHFQMLPSLSTYGDLALAPLRPLTTATLEGTMGDGWYVSDVTVTLHSSGGDGGVDHTTYRVNGGDWETYVEPFEVSTPGDALVEFYSVDMMGNEEETKSVSFTIETLEPNTTMSLVGVKGIGDYYVTPSVVVLLTASDDPGGSGLASTMYRLDAGAWIEYPAGGIEVDGDGTHTVEFYSTDNVGNEEAVKSETFGIDSTAPSTTAEVDGSDVTLTASDAGSGIAYTMYRVDGGEWMEYDDAFSVTAAGNHSVDFYSVDAAGNIEEMGSVTVQNAPSDEEVEDEEGGGISALVSGVLGLIIGAIVVAAIMMVLMRKKQPGEPSSPEEPAPESEKVEDAPPPPL
ncbi:MAG: hypothetical protein JSV90_08060 [Methanobacteriota archaeon]|nr:MAG: hypothetical protein JSV90_08060 [Euryarchaeota archaeon]